MPRSIPAAVAGPRVGEADFAIDATMVSGGFSFARPKSSSFAPDFVSITLPGLRSRWMTP